MRLPEPLPLIAPPVPEQPRGPRYHGLDGLRGVAAFVVLICHTFLVVPSLAYAYFAPDRMVEGSAAWWFAFSPLHLVWAGNEAVYLFFVLSGFVLALPFLNRQRWAGYYPKRLLRLYLPTWGAFLLVLFWLAVLPRVWAASDSPWLQAHPAVLAPETLVSQTLLLTDAPMSGNSVLWTLRFEVMFSLLLPLVLYAAVKLPRLNAVKAVLAFGAMFAFSGTPVTLRYLLPMFGLGVLLAVERERLESLAARIGASGLAPVVWTGLSLLAALLLVNGWTILGLTRDPGILYLMQRTSGAMTAAGACIAIFLAAEGPWRRTLERPAMRWLGRRSFSLYLVHEPLVVSVAVLLGGNPGLVPAMAVAIPASLLLAEAFYRLVERPSQTLARMAGTRVEGWFSGARNVRLPETVPAPTD